MGQASLKPEQLEIMLEIHDPDTWPGVASVWDTSTWDGGGDANEWTTARAGYVNVVCDVRGFVIERGRQTNWDAMLSANVELELDNSTGMYSIYGSHSWPRIRPGFAVEVTAIWKSKRYPLFVGKVSEYVEGSTPDDDTVKIKGQDAFYQLAVPITGDYNPGVPAELVSSRINRLLTRANFPTSLRTIDRGNATMLNYATSRTILDEIQLTANSDGGIFFIDNDGRAMYMDQSRVYGRARPPGVPIPSFTDACEGGLPYAAIEPIVGDQEFGNVIIVANESQGNDSPKTAKAVNETSIINNGLYQWSPDQLVICNAGYVGTLANFQLGHRSYSFYRINSFEVYPIHDDAIWDTVLPMRIGDSLFVTRTPPASQTIHAPMLMDGERIEATPEMWKFLIRCSPGNSIDIANFWDYDIWDSALWV